MIGDHFPDDGQKVSDPDWMEYGLAQGWSPLTQDLRIATQPVAMGLLRTYQAAIHCLDSAKLPAEVKANRFHRCQRTIYQHVIDRRVGFYVVCETGAPRRRR
jgi:PIN domain-containing protein